MDNIKNRRKKEGFDIYIRQISRSFTAQYFLRNNKSIKTDRFL